MQNPTVRDAVENCRYCFMCRHAGTAFRATKRDALTARGRALQLSRIRDGFDTWTPESADVMFSDPVDGLCRHLCAFHWPEDALIRESRDLIHRAGLTPQTVRDAIATMGRIEADDWRPAGTEIDSRAPVLFLSGWAARRAAGTVIDNTLAVLKAGFGAVRMLADERATASAALFDLGHGEEAAAAAKILAAEIGKIRPERIVTGCSHTLRVLHGETGGPDLSSSLRIEHYTETVRELASAGKLALKTLDLGGGVGLHDAEHLARTRGCIEAPRAVAAALLARPLREFGHHGAEAESAGAGAALFLTHPHLTAAIAATRLGQAGEAGIDLIVTACPHDYVALSPQATALRRVVDISELVRRAAGLQV